MPKTRILGMYVDVISTREAIETIGRWAQTTHASAYVCLANVHMAMVAYDDASFRDVVNAADATIADSRVLTWAQKLLGAANAEQSYGSEFTHRIAAEAARTGTRLGLFGGSPGVLRALRAELEKRHAGLYIAYACSPPFRPMTPDEDSEACAAINAAGVRILLVGLGCPKQEKWMAERKGRVNAVMLGVGAAFDFVAGAKADPPRWLRAMGLGWLFRLCTEPRRLWKRYLIQNSRFLWHFGRQLLRQRRGGA